MSYSMGHDLTLRDHNREKSTAPSDPEAYQERIARLMSSPGVKAWELLMAQNRARAERKGGAA